MTNAEYVQYVLDRFGQVCDIVEAATEGSGAEVERRYITPERREVDWIPLLKTNDGDGIVNKFLCTFSAIDGSNKGNTNSAFSTVHVFGIDYYRQYLQGTDAANTEKLFMQNLLAVQYELEKRYALDTYARIEKYGFGITIKRLQESVHYARGDVTVKLTNIQFGE